jgi:hypothetical protein
MAIYDDLVEKLDSFPKFYRFEGYTSYPYFGNQFSEELLNLNSYIYFSSSFNHHMYFTNMRIRSYIDKEIMRPMGLSFCSRYLIDSCTFNQIEDNLRNHDTQKLASISFITSSVMNNVLYRNSISNHRKSSDDRRIERVDTTKKGGGYGLPDLYLHLFQILTFAYTYQRITKDNLIEYLHILRYNLTTYNKKINPTEFLTDESLKSIKLNEHVFSDFSKYEVLNILEEIYERGLYFNDSVFADPSNIKSLLLRYVEDKDYFLDCCSSEYKKFIKKQY